MGWVYFVWLQKHASSGSVCSFAISATYRFAVLLLIILVTTLYCCFIPISVSTCTLTIVQSCKVPQVGRTLLMLFLKSWATAKSLPACQTNNILRVCRLKALFHAKDSKLFDAISVHRHRKEKRKR